MIWFQAQRGEVSEVDQLAAEQGREIRRLSEEEKDYLARRIIDLVEQNPKITPSLAQSLGEDKDDLINGAAVVVWENLYNYSIERASLASFVNMIIGNYLTNLYRLTREKKKIPSEKVKSLEEPIYEGEGEPITYQEQIPSQELSPEELASKPQELALIKERVGQRSRDALEILEYILNTGNADNVAISKELKIWPETVRRWKDKVIIPTIKEVQSGVEV